MINNVELITFEDYNETLIWTFDCNLPKDFIKNVNTNITSNLTDNFLPIKNRHVCGPSQEANMFLSEWNQYAKNKMLDLFYSELTKNAFIQRWPINKEKLLQYAEIHSLIYKDLPGFNMNPHLDNQFIIANMIINIVDNDCGTIFHNYRDKKEIIFESSGKANTGTLFLNLPHSVHSISNNSTRNRYVLYTSLIIPKD